MPPKLKPRVNLVLFNENKFGGTITYTAHLYRALKLAGVDCMIYRPGKGLGPTKSFGYGALHRTASMGILKNMGGMTLIAACIGKKFSKQALELMANGACMTVHDPNDLKYYDDTSIMQSDRIIIIRKNNTSICPNATFIPHPFDCYFGPQTTHQTRRIHAVTLSRLGSIKRTKWILEANRELPPDRQIWLRGHDDRFFTYNAFVRTGKFPEFKQDSEKPESERCTFGNEFGEAQRIASRATYLVDLTEIEGDGGGTQYTFLEGLDAGCVLVLNKAWIRPDGIWSPGVNCLTVGSPHELAQCLTEDRTPRQLIDMVHEARAILPEHDPLVIGQRYLTFLQGKN